MKGEIRLEKWRAALSADLPGKAAQQIMAPVFSGTFQHHGEPVRAGVMILLYPSLKDLTLVLIKRNEYDGHHSAQVSFPGGAAETGDRSIVETALREAREELGVEEQIEILGSLTPLHIQVSNFLVFPVVGWTPSRPEFKPDATEVQYLIESPVRMLLDPGTRDSETIYRHGKDIETPFYRVGEEKVWGATAMILSEFLQLAARLQPHHC
jgi:8-oxo-dGTP pyrophosphatase MutT (NUDIX family)